MRKNVLLKKGKLLDSKGCIIEAGYAYSLVKEYLRNDIKVSKLKIKEWDYYYFGDENYGIALTIDDNGYMGLTGATILDFKNKAYHEATNMFWFCLGRVNMPATSTNGSVHLNKKGYNFKFINDNGKRHLICEIKDFKNKYFYCDVTLNLTTPNSMVIVTPFKKKRHFYYNQKINLLKAEGYFIYGDIRYEFSKDCYGVLDWGRGVWTYSNTWYWSSLNGYEDGHTIGFNLGYGFGDTSQASENMVFYDQEVFKLDDVVFNIPKKDNKLDFLSKWTICDKQGKINLTFTPVLDRYSHINAIILGQVSHQVFGYFSGEIKTDNKTIKIKHLLGFAEKVKNRW